MGGIVTYAPAPSTLAPLPGGADNAAQAQAAVTRLAGTGRELHLAAGVWLLKSPVVIPALSPLTIRGASGFRTRIVLDLGGATYNDAGFYAGGTVPANAFSSTLTSDTVEDSAVIHTADKPAVGIWLEILTIADAGSVAEFATVLSATGSSSPYTVTLSKALGRVFVSGSQAAQVNPPVGLFFHHLAFSVASGKQAGRAIEIGAGQGCGAYDILVDADAGATVTEFAVGWDIGSDRITVERLTVAIPSGVTQPKAGISFEVASRFSLRDSIFINVGAVGGDAAIILSSPRDGIIDHVQTNGCTNGLILCASDLLDLSGAKRTVIANSTFAGGHVVSAEGGFGAGVGVPGVTFTDCTFADCAGGSVFASPSPVGAIGDLVTLRGCTTARCAPLFSQGAMRLVLEGHTSIDDAPYAVQVATAGTLTIRGADLSQSANVAWQGLRLDGSGRVLVSDLKSKTASVPGEHAGAAVVLTGTSEVEIRGGQFDGGSWGVITFGGGGAVVRVADVVQGVEVAVQTAYVAAAGDTIVALVNDPAVP